MKFQNLFLNFEQMHVQTNARMEEPKVICPFNFSKVGGTKNGE